MGAGVPFLSADLRGWLVSSTSSTSFSSPGGVPGCESSSSEGKSPLVAMVGVGFAEGFRDVCLIY